MAFFRTAARRGTMDSNNAMIRPNAARVPAGQGEPRPLDEEGAIGLNPYESWGEGADMLQARDGDLVKAWADQADGLVTFAALFSAVVTSFIIDSYTALQPDPRVITIDILRQILAELDGTALPGAAAQAATPFEPANSDVARNSLLFASLICSLLAAGMGIFYKEWLREYTRDLPSDPRELVRVRQLRYVGMQKWRMQAIISGISIFLQLGVAFFILAVVLFASSLHPVVSVVLNVFVIVWIVFWFGTAFCPLFSVSCPFKSPLSRFFFAVVFFARRVLRSARPSVPQETPNEDIPRTIEDNETRETKRRGIALDNDALLYLFNQHWGNAWLANIEPCIEDLPREDAKRLIQNLVVGRRVPLSSFMKVVSGDAEVQDAGVMRLAELWRRIQPIEGGPRSLSPTPMTYPPNPPSNTMETPRRPMAPDRNQTLVNPPVDGPYSSCSCGCYARFVGRANASSFTASMSSESSTTGKAMGKLPDDDGAEVYVSAVPGNDSAERMC